MTIDELQEKLDSTINECSMCGGNDNSALGILGRRVHLRCRACGWETSLLLKLGGN